MIYRQHLCPTFSTNTNYADEAAVIEMSKIQYPVTDGSAREWEMGNVNDLWSPTSHLAALNLCWQSKIEAISETNCHAAQIEHECTSPYILMYIYVYQLVHSRESRAAKRAQHGTSILSVWPNSITSILHAPSRVTENRGYSSSLAPTTHREAAPGALFLSYLLCPLFLINGWQVNRARYLPAAGQRAAVALHCQRTLPKTKNIWFAY